MSDFLCYFPDMLPTLAELAGATTPANIDGISLLPELLGESALGRKQEEHEFLYWELGGQTAVRMGKWKAIQPRKPQRVACDPVRGRYVLLRILSEVNDGPWASIAELGVVGK